MKSWWDLLKPVFVGAIVIKASEAPSPIKLVNQCNHHLQNNFLLTGISFCWHCNLNLCEHCSLIMLDLRIRKQPLFHTGCDLTYTYAWIGPLCNDVTFFLLFLHIGDNLCFWLSIASLLSCLRRIFIQANKNLSVLSVYIVPLLWFSGTLVFLVGFEIFVDSLSSSSSATYYLHYQPHDEPIPEPWIESLSQRVWCKYYTLEFSGTQSFHGGCRFSDSDVDGWLSVQKFFAWFSHHLVATWDLEKTEERGVYVKVDTTTHNEDEDYFIEYFSLHVNQPVRRRRVKYKLVCCLRWSRLPIQFRTRTIESVKEKES